MVAVTPGINEKTAMTSSDAYMDALAYTRNTTKEAVDSNYEASIPLGRLGRLEEVADAEPRAPLVEDIFIITPCL